MGGIWSLLLWDRVPIFYQQQGRIYNVKEARKMSVDAHTYSSEFNHYHQSGGRSLKTNLKPSIPKCLEYFDLLYIFNLVNHLKCKEKFGKRNGVRRYCSNMRDFSHSIDFCNEKYFMSYSSCRRV